MTDFPPPGPPPDEGATPPPPPPPPPPPGAYSSPSAGAGAYPPPGGTGTLPGPRAGFGERFVAALIDGILVGIVNAVLFGAFRYGGGLFSTVVTFAYYGFFEGGPAGQTVGKRVMNIRVVRADGSGRDLGWSTALVRNLCRYLSGIACLLGYLWMLWDKDQMTWHDKLSQTVVVPTSAYPPPPDGFGKPPTG